MPAHLDKPTPKKVCELKSRLEAEFSEQARLDDLMEGLITLSRPRTVPVFEGQAVTNTSRLDFGFGYVVWRENAQLLKLQPGFKVVVPDNEHDLRKHVDEVVEPLLAALWKQQTKKFPWFEENTDDYPAFGRAWAFSCHEEQEWAGDAIKSASQELLDAEDSEATKAAERKLYKAKSTSQPLCTRYVDPRNTWPVLGGKHWLPQVIEIRTLTRDEAEDEFGRKAIPDEWYDSGKSGKSDLKIVYYANHRWCCAVFEGKEPKFAEEPYEHKLDRNPYILFEADNLIRNKKGIRWVGLLFHAKDPIDFLDQFYTDLGHQHHEWTLSPIIIKHDKEEYDEDAKVAGRPKPVKYGPAEQIDIWNTESIERGPVPEISQQSIFLAMQVKEHIEKTAMVPAAERGEIKAGTSNNAYTSQIQVAQRRARGILTGMARFVEAWAGNQIKGICVLTEGTKEKVAVLAGLQGKYTLVEAGYEDVEGFEDAVTAIIDQPIEIDEYTRWLIGQLKVGKFGFSPEQIIEEMGYPNPEGITERGYDWRMDNAAFQVDYEAMLALSGQKYATLDPAQQSELGSLFASADPRIQEIVTQLSGTPTPSANGQAEANMQTTPQMPQNPMVPVQ